MPSTLGSQEAGIKTCFKRGFSKLQRSKPAEANDGPTLPQELIDSILDITDRNSLTACSRVARSFRHTSQKHIFSDIVIVPQPGYLRRRREYELTAQKLFQTMSGSPHLARNVLSIVLVEGTGIGSSPWMRRDIFPTLLAMFVNLTQMSIQSGLWLDWDSFPPASIEALQTAVALPSFVSLRLDNLRFSRSTELVSLLQCCRNLKSLYLIRVSVVTVDTDFDSPNMLSGLSSLLLDPLLLPVLHSVRSILDLGRLRYFQTTLPVIEMAAEAQHILDATDILSHYHVRLSHHHTDNPMLTLQRLPHLRTLEMSISFQFATSPDNYDPVGWVGSVLATSRDPSPIDHVILNISVEENDLPYLHHLRTLESFLLAPQMASLRTVTVNLDSFDVDFSICGGEREIIEAFSILAKREMLEVELLGAS
ncbi:hypothetical protein B0H15DRAFT_850158 [Mycena belliarum]|uniref:F-box domain-containing protein n=1 Tax=Mycena belliarum TaxID=1033014 RepID=A0AAD6XLY4_9AGAR|nr:hypothetical protein B0H15DRAFT_850158 [Mycena belliae]